MAKQKAIVLQDGKLKQLDKGDNLKGIDFHSGVRCIELGEIFCISENKEMRVRRFLKNFGTLRTKGLLIMD